MTKYKYPLSSKTVYGDNSTQWSVSGGSGENETQEYRVHIQNIEIMYERVTQYSTVDGTVDFNYLDCNFTVEASREHIYLNSSSGDYIGMQKLDLISDSSSGGLGLSGVVRTSAAGVTRRPTRAGDVEAHARVSGNVLAGKMPGGYLEDFDVSGNTNSTVLDMIVAAKGTCPEFEINLVDL